ncbi:MAG: hypothetical protein KAI24_10710 [Planctomycetes bacterium]|nr:hypothetical protein [Planctomycetota bacterium]
MSLYAEYDEASRLTEIYDGDYGVTHIVRDGPGRMIKRYVTLSSSKPSNYDMIAGWNGQDWMRRDALGRLQQNDYYTIGGK